MCAFHVAVGTHHFALGDLFDHLLDAAVGVTQVEQLHPTHVIELHHVVRVLDPTVSARDILGFSLDPTNLIPAPDNPSLVGGGIPALSGQSSGVSWVSIRHHHILADVVSVVIR